MGAINRVRLEMSFYSLADIMSGDGIRIRDEEMRGNLQYEGRKFKWPSMSTSVGYKRTWS